MKQLIIGNCDSQNKKLNKKERPHYFTAPDEFYRQRKKFPYCSSYSNSCFKIINRPQKKKLQLKKSMRNSCHKSRFKSKTTSKQFIFWQCALICYFGGTNNSSWCKSISEKCWRQCLWFLSGNISIFWHWSDCSTNLFSIVFKLGLNQSQHLLSIYHIWNKLFQRDGWRISIQIHSQ